MNISDENNIFIEITITNSCNCNCSYCFEGAHHCNYIPNEAEEDKQVSVLKNLCDTFDKTKHKWLTFSFWGGEPFLNLKFMCKIIENTYKYDFVRYHCYSNGTLLDTYREFLSKPFIKDIKDKIHIQLSYDGDPHNELKRGYKKDKILQAADLLNEAGISFVFKATLAFDMIPHLVEIWKSYEELFYKYPNNNVRYIPTIDTANTSAEYYDDWKKVLLEVAKLEYKFIDKNGFPLWTWFSDGHKMSCRLKNTFHIHTDGNIYVCHGAPYLKNNKLKIGNTSTTDLNDLLKTTQETHQLLESCIKCSATYCSVCHVVQLSEDDDVYEGWIRKRPSNQTRCKYYKYFGYISKLLKYSNICRSKYKL